MTNIEQIEKYIEDLQDAFEKGNFKDMVNTCYGIVDICESEVMDRESNLDYNDIEE